MADRFEGDPRLILNEYGADIVCKGGQPVMDAGLENAVLLSLFSTEWFGNVFFADPNEHLGGKFLDAINKPLSINAVNAIRTSALADLQWLLDSGAASEVVVDVSNPEAKKIQVIVLVKPPNKDIQALVLEKNGVNWINQTIDPAYLRLPKKSESTIYLPVGAPPPGGPGGPGGD